MLTADLCIHSTCLFFLCIYLLQHVDDSHFAHCRGYYCHLFPSPTARGSRLYKTYSPEGDWFLDEFVSISGRVASLLQLVKQYCVEVSSHLSLGAHCLGAHCLGAHCLGAHCLGAHCLGAHCLGAHCLGAHCLGAHCLGAHCPCYWSPPLFNVHADHLYFYVLSMDSHL